MTNKIIAAQSMPQHLRNQRFFDQIFYALNFMTGFQNNQEFSTQAAQTTMRLSKIAKSPTALQYRQYIGKEVDNILNFVNYGCSLLDFYVGKC